MKKVRFDCVGFGVCPVDYICLVKKYPGLEEKLSAVGSLRQGGGPVATALCALGRWGAGTAIISSVGVDPDGRFVRSDFIRHNVNTLNLRMEREKATPRAFLWVETSTGRRTVALDESSSPAPRARDYVLKHLPDCRVFHTDGRYPEAALKLMKHYRRRGAAVVMDAGSPRADMESLISNTDHFVASDNFVRKYFGARTGPEKACAGLLKMGPEAVVITLGGEGCVGADRSGVFKLKGLRKKNFVVDTNGAGDVFHAGYIYGLLKGMPVAQCAEFGNAAAFLKCGSPGGRTGIPSVKQVFDMIPSSD